MTGFRGWTEAGTVVDQLTPESLRQLLLSAQEYVAVDSPPRGAEHRARASRVSSEFWTITVGSAPGRVRRLDRANTDAAFDILRSWAAGDDWWAEAFTWQPV